MKADQKDYMATKSVLINNQPAVLDKQGSQIALPENCLSPIASKSISKQSGELAREGLVYPDAL